MRHRVQRLTSLAAAAGLATAMAAAPALAQGDRYQSYQQPPPAAETMEVSDARLGQFVDALHEVSTIREAAVTELEGTTDTAEAQQVQQDAQHRMVEAVQASGLTVEEYNEIATLMGTDPELQQRVQVKLEKLDERG